MFRIVGDLLRLLRREAAVFQRRIAAAALVAQPVIDRLCADGADEILDDRRIFRIVKAKLPAGPEQQAAVESVLGVRSYPTYRLADRTGRVLDVPADPRRLAELLESVKGIAGQE